MNGKPHTIQKVLQGETTDSRPCKSQTYVFQLQEAGPQGSRVLGYTEGSTHAGISDAQGCEEQSVL